MNRKIIFISITIPSLIAVLIFANWANSYDFSPSTKENPYGFEAVLAYQRNLTHSCMIPPCHPVDVFTFSFHSEKPAWLVGYNICGGISCIKANGGKNYQSASPHLSENVEKWAFSTIGNLPWKVGDTVNIRVKVMPAIILEDGRVVEGNRTDFIDLGESKVIEIFRTNN